MTVGMIWYDHMAAGQEFGVTPEHCLELWRFMVQHGSAWFSHQLQILLLPPQELAQPREELAKRCGDRDAPHLSCFVMCVFHVFQWFLLVSTVRFWRFEL